MRIWFWLARPRVDLDEEDFNEEIRAHLAIAAEEQIADGVDPEDARYAALREFGNVTRTREAVRSIWTPRWVGILRDHVSDVRYAVRTLAKNPIFSLAVVAVLTIGIGLNAAVFTMLKSVALAPVAGVRGSADLAVIIGETSGGRRLPLAYPEFEHLRRNADAFTALMGSAVATVNLGRGPGARQVWAEIVTGNYFEVLGVAAQQGRTLLPSDERAPGSHPVVVISNGLWRRDFGADPGIIGRTLEINNQRLTIVGVADARFHGTTVVYDVDVVVPVTIAPQLGFRFGSDQTTPAEIFSDPRATFFYPQGYLRPGATLESAAAQVQALWTARAVERPERDVAKRLRVVPFWQMPSGAPSFVLPSLVVLAGMGLLVLIIACANIAGLVLVRGVSRRGEIAVRLALGATRSRIVRLLIVENLVLALPGAFFGVLLARYTLPVLVSYAEWLASPQRLFFNIDLDGLVVTFAVAIASGSALLFGFLPAVQSSRVDLVSTINEDASPRGAARGRMRATLVVAQVAVSLLLLVGAGLATRSVEAARAADPGFDPRGVTSIALDLKQNGYDPSRGRVFYRNLLEAARRDPSVESAALELNNPMSMQDTRLQRVTIEGYDPALDEDLAFMSNVVTPDYFRTLRIPLAAGREFHHTDNDTSAPVVIVNQTFATRFWGTPDQAIGRRLRLGTAPWRTVVGVAADVKYARVDEAPRPYFYLPLDQAYRSDMILHTRGGDVEHLLERGRGYVASLDANLPTISARPMTDTIRGALIFYDFTATMLFVFGVAGMALTAMGTYGLVSYTVKQSAHENGIRMALGASGSSVVRAFLGRGLRLGLTGAAIGIVAAAAVSSVLSSVLFGVSATDALTFGRALLLVLGGVALATLVPAWRAARMNPLGALRHQ